ncbi:PREDICTED: neuronal acetylcholine receptor subunit alpha-9-like [Branchiostoma belcheri]|uniref:Neuronal acetylcholine receptor subunit alpha-9-like n=1 Tax=Branchiostoma belcheri TaxID=7741 RepID=A0A6P4Y129_BRABE|nr:PREDICTED: neuronal acetylcholine receptor subunit alpha-9-like [Branchiostoma belcheri]
MAAAIFLCCLLIHHSCVLTAATERTLLDALLVNYTSDARPVKDPMQNVTVRFELVLAQIIEVIARDQMLTVNVWFRHYWDDEFLVWNPEDYDGITSIRIPSEKIWRPDIVLYERIHEEGWSETPNTHAHVNHNGSVQWLYPITLKSSCLMDVSLFPYDVQSCPLKFSSWAYDGLAVDIVNTSATGDSENFIQNEEWDLVSFAAAKNIQYYNCCTQPYPDVTFTIEIARKALYYNYYVLAPCIIIVIISLLGFCLPPDSGEKLSLSITMLLSLVVFMQLVADSLPATSTTIPLIGQFFGATIVIVALSSVLTIFILSIHFRGPNIRPVPKWLKRIFFIKACKCKQLSRESRENHHADPEISREQRELPELNRIRRDSSSLEKTDLLQDRSIRYMELHKRIDIINEHLEEMLRTRRSKASTEAIEEEWKSLAVKMDRCLLVLFFVLSFITLIVIMSSIY